MRNRPKKINILPSSVVMPVLNNLKYTKKCLDSVLPTLTPQDELIIIDNNSTDGTKEFLLDIAKKNKNVKVISFRSCMGEDNT